MSKVYIVSVMLCVLCVCVCELLGYFSHLALFRQPLSECHRRFFPGDA